MLTICVLSLIFVIVWLAWTAWSLMELVPDLFIEVPMVFCSLKPIEGDLNCTTRSQCWEQEFFNSLGWCTYYLVVSPLVHVSLWWQHRMSRRMQRTVLWNTTCPATLKRCTATLRSGHAQTRPGDRPYNWLSGAHTLQASMQGNTTWPDLVWKNWIIEHWWNTTTCKLCNVMAIEYQLEIETTNADNGRIGSRFNELLHQMWTSAQLLVLGHHRKYIRICGRVSIIHFRSYWLRH